MSRIFCLGETVYDIIFKNGTPVAAKAGGSMLNSAVSMGKTDLPVHFISEYGTDDIGNEIDSFLHSVHVNTQYVYRHSLGKTSIAIAFLDELNNAHYTFYKDQPEKRLGIVFPKPEEDDIVLFGSFFAINKEIRKQVTGFVKKAKQAGSSIVYDPNYRKAHHHELPELLPLIIENMQLASIVRGSDEDFQMICNAGNIDEAYKFVSQYCPILLYTSNIGGVHLRTNSEKLFCSVPKLNPLSTIGAGDNFNAGIIYGLIKENVDLVQLSAIENQVWLKIMNYGIDFASDVCMSYDNYISDAFAANIKN